MKKPERQIISLIIKTDTIEKIRDYVYWTPGITISSFINKVLSDAARGIGEVQQRPFKQLQRGRKVS